MRGFDYDEAVYEQLDSMLPEKVERWSAQSALDAGEPEVAIGDLLDAAYLAGNLTEQIADFVTAKYDSGPVIEMLEALRMFDEQKNSVA